MSFTDPEIFYLPPSYEVGRNATISVHTGTPNSAYPVSRATNFGYAVLAQPSLLQESTGAWLWDFGVAQRFDGMLLWHNFDPELECAVEAHAANSWEAPAFSQALTIPEKFDDGFTRKVFVDFRESDDYTETGLRFVRLNVSGTNSVPIGMKALLYSNIGSVARDLEWGIEDVDHKVGIDMRTDALYPWAYDLKAAPRLFRASGLFSTDDMRKLKAWHRACAGFVTPTVLVDTPSSGEGRLVRFSTGTIGPSAGAIAVSSFSSTEAHEDGHRVSLLFEEISAGDPEWT